MRAALYARISTGEQQTLPMQLDAMREYVARRGWSVAYSVEEVGSGAKARPRREELLKDVRRRKVDVVIVWRLDRWGRSLADLVVSLDELRELGVGFVSVTEALDLTTPGGRALAGMLAVFAQFERDVLRERVAAGIAAARARGTRLGRPRATLPIDRDRMRAMKDRGVSTAEIARKFGVARATVREALGPG